MKALQKFNPDYLRACKEMKPSQIIEFLDNFRLLNGERLLEGRTKLISIKMPEPLLEAFRRKCEIEGIAYQTKIKALMKEWLLR